MLGTNEGVKIIFPLCSGMVVLDLGLLVTAGIYLRHMECVRILLHKLPKTDLPSQGRLLV